MRKVQGKLAALTPPHGALRVGLWHCAQTHQEPQQPWCVYLLGNFLTDTSRLGVAGRAARELPVASGRNWPGLPDRGRTRKPMPAQFTAGVSRPTADSRPRSAKRPRHARHPAPALGQTCHKSSLCCLPHRRLRVLHLKIKSRDRPFAHTQFSTKYSEMRLCI
jgi:hypothetical protein